MDDRDPVGWRPDVLGRCPCPDCAPAPAAASLAAGAIGRSLVDAAEAYRAHLAALQLPAGQGEGASTVQD